VYEFNIRVHTLHRADKAEDYLAQRSTVAFKSLTSGKFKAKSWVQQRSTGSVTYVDVLDEGEQIVAEFNGAIASVPVGETPEGIGLSPTELSGRMLTPL
jgi:hypothetical protein